MILLLYIFIFILGTLIGSFLNVVIYRYNTGRTLMGRSFCFFCNKTLSWRELFPVFSFLFQGGRCRTCRGKIAWQYMGVELLTGFLFLSVFWRLNGEELLFLPLSSVAFSLLVLNIVVHLIIFSLLVVIIVYDFKHKIIPNAFSYGFAILSLLLLLGKVGGLTFSYTFIAHIVSGLLFSGFFAFLWMISKGRWIGFGDAKLALGIGFFLGPQASLSAFLLAFWIGAIVSVLILLLEKISVLQHIHLPFEKKRFTIKSEIPFAPFLILGLILAFLGVHPLAILTLNEF